MTKEKISISVGLTILAVLVFVAVFAPLISPYNPVATSSDILAQPSSAHWFGTDSLGRDVFSRVLHGTRISLSVGFMSAVIALCIGAPVGLIAGYFRGPVDFVLVQVIDILIALPGLVLALLITSMLGTSVFNLSITLGFVASPTVARLVRSQVMVVRQAVFVEAAKSTGASSFWIMSRHIFPNVMGLIWAQLAITVSYAIFTAASLSFLGLGVPPPAADWGSMVREGTSFLPIAPVMSLGPGAAVALSVFAFHLIGSGRK